MIKYRFTAILEFTKEDWINLQKKYKFLRKELDIKNEIKNELSRIADGYWYSGSTYLWLTTYELIENHLLKENFIEIK